MQFLTLVAILGSLQKALAAPIVVTREHTAAAVTVTDTYTTVTNTHTAPTVEILVSDGVTYTFTLTDSTAYPVPTTFTSIVNKAVTTPAVTVDDETTETTEAAETTPATTTLQPATSTTAESTQAEETTPADDTTTAAEVTKTNVVATASPVTVTNSAVSTNTHTASAVRITTTLQAPTAMATSIATPTTTPTTTAAASTSTQATTTSSVATTGDLARPTAIVYSPYNDDASCKDYDTVKSDLELIHGVGIYKIRVYGTDCNSIENVLPNAAALGMTVNQGFWFSDAGADSIDDAVTSIISYASSNGWSVFDFLTIGNEAVQSGYITADELVSKISSVRSQIEAAGYTGQFTTSEPPVTFETYPSLCDADVDFIGVNPHAYFDPYSSAATAGEFVKGQVAIVQGYCSNKDILVTETGYPSAGITNGGNVPSKANQKIALINILSEMNNEVTILSTYNDYWKDPGSYGIEQSFGIIDLYE